MGVGDWSQALSDLSTKGTLNNERYWASRKETKILMCNCNACQKCMQPGAEETAIGK